MASTDAKPMPQKNVAHRVTFPIFDATGSLVSGATSLDSEVSKDAGTFTDCTNEATEIATSSGMYYLDLTSTEMNADTVAIIVKSGNGKTTPITLYPEEAGDLRVNVTQISGDATAADNAESYFDGTGYAGTNNVIPLVTTVTNLTNSATAGDFTATQKTSITTAATAATPTAAAVTGNVGGNVVGSVGSVTGSVGSVTGNVGGNVTGSVGSVASGGITAASIATNAIDADAIASDAVAEIQSGLATATNLSALDTKIGTPSNLGGGASIAANLSDIEAQTDDIGAAGAGLTALATQASVNDLPTNAELATALAGVPDAVWDEVLSESDFQHTWSGITPRKIMADLFAGFRNKWTSTNSSKVLRNDADSAALGTRAISDNGTTYTDGEMG